MDDDIRIQHMLDAAYEVRTFLRGRTRNELDTDRQLAHSIIKDIKIIGEAATAITEATRQRYPGIPWEQIIGMRNRLVHVYFDVDLDIIWETAREELPELVAHLESNHPSDSESHPESE